MKYRVLFAFFLVLSSPSIATEQQTYKNQVGSKMVLNHIDKNTIAGTYQTAVGCGVGIERPLVGWKNGRAITFTVDFQECDSLTSWVGHIQKNGDIITLWTLAKGNEGWDAKLTGTSHFKPVRNK